MITFKIHALAEKQLSILAKKSGLTKNALARKILIQHVEDLDKVSSD
jgi:hypothetical protein